MLEHQCAEVVDALLSTRHWRLIERDEFVGRTYAYVRDGTIKEPQRAAIHTYCQVLYAACSGAQGAERQNIGYEELHRYVYDIARWRYADVCAEAAQDTIEEVFERFHDCRHEATFLAFALQCLRSAVRFERRWKKDLSPEEQVPSAELPDPEAGLIRSEQHEKLRRMAEKFLRDHPKAKRQFATLWFKYVAGMSDWEIGERLDVPVKRVYELRSLAIKRLRNDAEWTEFAAASGILPFEP